MKITQNEIKNIETPKSVSKLYFDDELKGFGCRVTPNGIKSYIVCKRMGSKIKRLTIGRCNEVSLKDAREEARKILSQVALGKNPFIERKISKNKMVTMEDIFNNYLLVRKGLSDKTIYTYTRAIHIHLKEWKDLKPSEITKGMVLEKYNTLAESYDASTATLSMKLLKSLYNFYQALNEDANIQNPVKILSATKSWFKIPVRKSFIKKHELKPWYEALQKCKEDMRDYLLFILLTGLRRQEAATLKWEQVDFQAMIFTIIDTKNGTPHELPLTTYLYKLLYYRDKSGEYVFPGQGKKGHILDPFKSIKNITKETGIKFTVHDLRRTFATIADSLDISSYALKRLLNHSQKGDVTSGYIGSDVERLRKPMEEINQFVFSHLFSSQEKSNIQ